MDHGGGRWGSPGRGKRRCDLGVESGDRGGRQGGGAIRPEDRRGFGRAPETRVLSSRSEERRVGKECRN